MRFALFRKGLTHDSANMTFLAHKVTTTRQYQGIWLKFYNFLLSQNVPHDRISIGIVCNFLCFHCTTHNRKYRTLATYRSALRHPLLFALDLDVNAVCSDLFMRGVFNYVPPVVAKSMPSWNLNSLLNFLLCPVFEPLESADYKRLTQKTLCLILLASGRRISEVANISRTSLELPSLSSLSLGWVPGFLPKTHSPSHQPSCPSIGYLSSDNGSSLPLCPVRAYRIYLARSSSWLADAPPHLHHHYLWSHQRNPRPASISYLSSKFRDLVADSRRFNDLDPGVDAGPHQMRKLSASYALQVGQNEDKVVRVMGFASSKIFRKNYVSWVPPLTVPCVLPGGPFFPQGVVDLSDTD